MPHKFTLIDLATLELGRSTQAQVEEVLGKPSLIAGNTVLHESHAKVLFPSAPLLYVAWPFAFGWQTEDFAFLAHYNAEGQLEDASLTIAGTGALHLWLVFRTHGGMWSATDEQKVLLRRIEANGMTVWLRFPSASGGRLMPIRDGELVHVHRQ